MMHDAYACSGDRASFTSGRLPVEVCRILESGIYVFHLEGGGRGGRALGLDWVRAFPLDLLGRLMMYFVMAQTSGSYSGRVMYHTHTISRFTIPDPTRQKHH